MHSTCFVQHIKLFSVALNTKYEAFEDDLRRKLLYACAYSTIRFTPQMVITCLVSIKTTDTILAHACLYIAYTTIVGAMHAIMPIVVVLQYLYLLTKLPMNIIYICRCRKLPSKLVGMTSQPLSGHCVVTQYYL